jgi:hypothetical protein
MDLKKGELVALTLVLKRGRLLIIHLRGGKYKYVRIYTCVHNKTEGDRLQRVFGGSLHRANWHLSHVTDLAEFARVLYQYGGKRYKTIAVMLKWYTDAPTRYLKYRAETLEEMLGCKSIRFENIKPGPDA